VLAGAAVAEVAVLAVAAVLRTWDRDDEDGLVQTVLGDPHTADPCALMTAESLARFGDATLDPDYGGFNRCDVVVEVPDEPEIDVRVEFSGGDGGTGKVVRGAPERDDDSCDVTITLADGNLAEIVAKTDDETPATCARWRPRRPTRRRRCCGSTTRSRAAPHRTPVP